MRLSSNLRRFRWVVFAAWLLLLVPSVYLALNQSGNLTGGGFQVAGSQSLHVEYETEDHYPDQGASPLALVAAPRADASFEDMNAAVAQLERIAAEIPNVKIVPAAQQPPPQPDRPYVVTLQTDFDSGSVDVAKQLRKKVGIDGDQPGQIDNGKVKLYVIGQGALGAAASEATKHDIAQAEKWNLPIVLIVLLAVFGSLAAAAMPLVLGICTVVVTMGLVYLLSMFTEMSVFVTSTVSMFGIALAVDYSLFILMRFREELRSGRDPAQAADAAMATSGLAVLLSGLTVIASMTGIYLINTPVLASMATGAILAVAVAVLTSTTLTPAVLATFGKAAAKRSSWLHFSRRPDTTQSRFWTRWVGSVMRRPWLSAAAATAFLLTIAAPAFAMTLGNSLQRQFEPTHEIRGGVNAAAEALGPGALGPVRVLVTFPTLTANEPQNAAALDAVRQTLTQAPDVITVTPPVFSDDNHSALLSAVLSVDPEDMGARTSIDWMRQHLPGTAGQQVSIDVGGPTALIKDFDDRVAATQPAVFGFVALIAFVMLLISIRSVFLALKGVLMTVLSVACGVRQPGGGIRVGLARSPWLPTDLVDRQHHPAARPRDDLRVVDGLRDLPADPHPGAVPADQQHPRRRRLRGEHQRPHHHQRGADHDRGVHRLRVRGHAVGRTARRGLRGGDRRGRHRGATGPGARADGDVRAMELVAARLAGPHPAVGGLREAAAEGGHRRPRHHSRRHLRARPVRLRHPDGGQVGGEDETPRPADHHRCRPSGVQRLPADRARAQQPRQAATRRLPGVRTTGRFHRTNGTRNGAGATKAIPCRAVHPVTMWRGRLSVALDALATAAADTEQPVVERRSPMETTNVQLPTGDRLQIPTGAETLRLKSYLIMCRNSAKDFAELADLVDSMETQTAAVVLARMDRYYSGQHARNQWVATQLVRRLADPHPSDVDADSMSGPDAEADWARVRQRCLSVAVAMLEEAR